MDRRMNTAILLNLANLKIHYIKIELDQEKVKSYVKLPIPLK